MLASIVSNLISSIVVDKESIYDYLKHQYMKEILIEEKLASQGDSPD
jgi:hypothetical protein